MNALGGIAATIDPTIAVASAIAAGASLDLLRSPQLLADARAEFDQRREAAGDLQCLLPDDFEPPIDLRWPEYVTTARGREWWIPNQH